MTNKNIKYTFDKYISEPNIENRNKILEESLPVIDGIVKKFQNGKVVEKSDLFQEGIYGVLKAISKSSSGEDFEKKIFSYVKAAVLNYTKQQSIISLNNYAQDKSNKVNKFITQFISSNEREPSNKEISRALNIKLKNINQFRSITNPTTELNENIEDENDDFKKLNEYDDIKRLLSIMEDKLSQKEKEVILMKYGINYPKAMTLEEIGQNFKPKLCKQRVDQIHKSILLKLKKHLEV